MNNKKGIIEKYNNGIKVTEIAKIYGVAIPTIYVKLKQWEGELKKSKGVIMDTGYYERLIRDYTRSCLSTKIIGETDEDCTISFKVKSSDFEINNAFTVTKKEAEKWKKDKVKDWV